MKPAYEVFAEEIPAKGKGYLALRRCKSEEVSELLSRGREELLSLGAAELFVTSTAPEAPLREGGWDGFSLIHIRDMLWMERDLDAIPVETGGVVLTPLTRERGGAWLALHNECFFDMPNSATYGSKDLERALSSEYCCGFVQWRNIPVGVYGLDMSQTPPIIDGIALHKDFRGKGLGRKLLAAVLCRLSDKGCQRCRLLVATDNDSAFALYRLMGFKAAGVQSQWFQMLAK